MTDGNDYRKDLTLAIGRVTLASSSMEFWTSAIFAHLIGGEHADELAYGPAWQAVMQGCTAILRKNPKTPMKTALLGFLQTADKLHQQRHEVVHGLWLGRNEKNTFTVRLRYHGKRTVTEWTLAKLDALADETWEVAGLFQMVDRLMCDKKQDWETLSAADVAKIREA